MLNTKYKEKLTRFILVNIYRRQFSPNIYIKARFRIGSYFCTLNTITAVAVDGPKLFYCASH